MGWCRLKVSGVEHCGLCGLAHIGHGRTCPHLNSETQVATLLGTLKESTEQHELIDKATKYLRMIRGDLVQRKRLQEAKLESQHQARPEPMGYRPRMDPVNLDGNADGPAAAPGFPSLSVAHAHLAAVAGAQNPVWDPARNPARSPARSPARNPVQEWRNASVWSMQHGLRGPARPNPQM